MSLKTVCGREFLCFSVSRKLYYAKEFFSVTPAGNYVVLVFLFVFFQIPVIDAILICLKLIDFIKLHVFFKKYIGTQVKTLICLVKWIKYIFTVSAYPLLGFERMIWKNSKYPFPPNV